MPNASNAKLQYEGGQTTYAMSLLSDSGDHTTFACADAPLSRVTGYELDLRPDGLKTGGLVTPAASGADDAVDVSAGTAYVGGELVIFAAATDLAITRAVDTDTHAITSITVTSAGAVAAVAGTDGTAFIETRDAAGGPPLIPTTSIEIGQVRTSSATAGAVVTAEIKQTVGVHQERFDYPSNTVDYYNGEVTFVSALPSIHTGPTTKGVYASYAVPIFTEVQFASDFTAPETSYSVSSTQIYGGTLGSTSESLGAGGFTAFLENGVTDTLLGLTGENLWFKFFPHRQKTSHVACQGVLGITRSFPASGNIQASCTINAESAAANVAG